MTLITILHYLEVKFDYSYWPAHPDDPQGIRVASVIEFSVCLSVLCSKYFFLISTAL